MHTHITINGQTYPSIDQMPPDVRQQYESAMKLISENTHILAHAAPGNVTISTTGSDPAHHTVRTFTTMSTNRIVVNGKEYSSLEDVPLMARAALKSAGLGSQMPRASGAPQIPDGYQLNYNASPMISFSRATLAMLLIFALGFGVFIGIFIGYKLLH